MVTSTGRLQTKLFLNGSDLWFDLAKTDENLINIDTWYFVAFSFFFDGVDTHIEIFRDTDEMRDYTAQENYIEDQLSYANTFLHMTTDRKANEAAPEPADVFAGYIYWFQLWYKPVQATNDYLTEVLGNYAINCASDGCTCDKCPTEPSSRCLWTAERDQFQNDTCDFQACNETGESTTCTTENGCVRSVDCNRCDDRLCRDCINFDAGRSDYVVCEQCIQNASVVNGSCVCNQQYYWDQFSFDC